MGKEQIRGEQTTNHFEGGRRIYYLCWQVAAINIHFVLYTVCHIYLCIQSTQTPFAYKMHY